MVTNRTYGFRNGQMMHYIFEVLAENESDVDSRNSLKLRDIVEGVIRLSKYKGEYDTIYKRVSVQLSLYKDIGYLRKFAGKRWGFDWQNPKNTRYEKDGGLHRLIYKLNELRDKTKIYGWDEHG